jgi:hypothetical protein
MAWTPTLNPEELAAANERLAQSPYSLRWASDRSDSAQTES